MERNPDTRVTEIDSVSVCRERNVNVYSFIPPTVRAKEIARLSTGDRQSDSPRFRFVSVSAEVRRRRQSGVHMALGCGVLGHEMEVEIGCTTNHGGYDGHPR